MSGLVLQCQGDFYNIHLPSTAQSLTSHWTHDSFPNGVKLHKMIHIQDPLKTQMIGNSRKTLSLSLLCDARFSDSTLSDNGRHCNYHEIPQAMDSQLFFGDILMILTLDGSTIIPLSHEEYRYIVDTEITQDLSNYSRFSESPRTPARIVDW